MSAPLTGWSARAHGSGDNRERSLISIGYPGNDMRNDGDASHSPEWAPWWVWIRRGDSETGTGELVGAQGIDEGVLVNEATSTDIDNDAGRTERNDGLIVDDVV